MLITCPECGHQVSDQAKTCPSCGIRIAGKVTKKKRKNIGRLVFIASLIIAVAIVGTGVYLYKSQEQQNEERAYRNALQNDQPAVLQNYLDMFAQAPQAHRDSIRLRLTALRQVNVDWERALASGSKAELEKFMRRHPNSVHNIEAKLQIDSLDWASACRADTPEAYQAYLSAHYDGAYYDEAMNAYDRSRAEAEARRRQQYEDSIRRQDSLRQAAERSSGLGGVLRDIFSN